MPPKTRRTNGSIYKRRKRYNKKKVTHLKKYRRPIATIARPLNVKPRSALQNVTYYQSFNCDPQLNSALGAGLKQQNFSIEIALNSLWP